MPTKLKMKTLEQLKSYLLNIKFSTPQINIKKCIDLIPRNYKSKSCPDDVPSPYLQFPFRKIRVKIPILTKNVLVSSELFKRISKRKQKDTGKITVSGYWKKDIINLLSAMKSRFKALMVKEQIPEWKARIHPYKHQERVDYYTARIMYSLATAKKVSFRLQKLDELLHHIENYPEAMKRAVESNVIPLLLLMQRRCEKEPVAMDIIDQLLPLFGYVKPPNSNGIRILSIDGGGMRGIAVIKMLQHLEKISGKKIYELFDFMCGVSTGAIIICCLLPPHCMSLREVHNLYMDMSSKVFKQNIFWGTGKLIWSHGYYDTNVWENLLKEHVGQMKLMETNKFPNCPKVALVSTVTNLNKVTPYLFRNYVTPAKQFSMYQGGPNHTMFEAVRASAAAPTIFEEFRTGKMIHHDGGLIVNNPTAVALQEAHTLWPKENVSCIVSCGTGKHEPLSTIDPNRSKKETGSSSWSAILRNILESATDTEGVHSLMSELFTEGVYYRLNPNLSCCISMDDTNKERLNQLERNTDLYSRRIHSQYIRISKILQTKRSLVKSSQDKLNLFREMNKV